MFKIINILVLVSLTSFFACSLFDKGGKRKGSDTSLIYSGSGAVLLDDSIGDARGDEIYQAIKDNLVASMENNAYKYGAKSQAKSFTAEQLRVLIGSCGQNSTNCSVELFIDKASDTMRPLFVIKPTPVASCPDKYKAFLSSVMLLSKEAVDEGWGYGSITTGSTGYSFDSFCPLLASNDFLCNKKEDLLSYKKMASYAVSYGDSIFDVSTSSTSITITEAKFIANKAENLICITDLIKPSLWGKTRLDKGSIATFKVSLKMKE